MSNQRQSPVEIRFFGAFELRRAEGPVPQSAWRTEVNRTLVKLLASARGRFFPKDVLIEHVWPEAKPTSAAASLRRRIAEVRRILEPDLASGRSSRFILTRREGYAFDAEAPVWIDLEAFARRLKQGNALWDQDDFEKAARAFESAVALYAGEFLPEDPYVQWVVEARRDWQEQYGEALAKLAECHARLGRYQRAIACCNVLVSAAPQRESAYRQLMLYQHLAGLTGDARLAYLRCESALHEIGAAPGERTRALYEQIRQGHVPGVDVVPLSRQAIPTFEPRYALSPSTIPFVSREDALGQLGEWFERAGAGHPAFILIEGEAGVGKTRLVQEFLRTRVPSSNTALQGEGQEGAMLAYQAWSGLLRQAVFGLDRNALGTIPVPWLGELLPLVPELQARLPELEPNPALPPQAAQMRLFESTVQFLKRYRDLQRASPLVLFFDDLMWMDSFSLALLNYLLSRLEDAPILVVGTSRDARSALDTGLKSWHRKGAFHTVTLNRLSEPEVRRLLGALPFSAPVSSQISRWLFRETEGHPLFVVSALQHLFECGLLRAEGGVWSGQASLPQTPGSIRLPPTLRDLIERRLEQLPPGARRFLALASVAGVRVNFTLLERAWGGEEDPLPLLERLLAAQFLRETEMDYRFVHTKFRQFVYERLSRPRRRRLHRQILAALETLPRSRAAELARHAHAAGAWAQAARYAVNAVREALASHQVPEGLQWVELGLSALESWRSETRKDEDSNEVGFELVKQRFELLDLQGDREAQADALRQLERLAEASGTRAKLALVRYQHGRLLFRRGDLKEAEPLVREALALARAAKDQSLAFSAQLLLGLTLLNSGRVTEALEESRQAFALAGKLDNPRFRGMALNNLGITYKELGRNREALRCSEEALAEFEQVGDRYGQAIFHDNISIEYRLLGDYGSALSHSQAALLRFRRIGNRQGEGVCLNNRGRLYLHLGAYEDALRLLDRALEVSRRAQDALTDGFVYHNLGKCYCQMGDFEEANDSLSKALQVRKDVNNLKGQALTLTELGELRRLQGQPDAALELLRQAESIFDELGPSRDRLALWNALTRALLDLDRPNEALARSKRALAGLKAGLLCDDAQTIHYDHARVLRRLGRVAEADEHLQRARDEVRSRAERILDERLRKRFLADVPLNRKIMEDPSLSS